MMDALFPSSNWLGIPDLDVGYQADALSLPLAAWGSRGRSLQHEGTWHFYVHDSRFSAALREPGQVVATGCAAAVEPNISAYEDTPLALALAAIYRKRWVARYWQTCGVRVWVDLNLPARVLDRPEFAYGIPPGWSAFATRGYDRRPGDLEREYQFARQYAAGVPVFLVVGGGRLTAEWCVGRTGVIHGAYSATREVYSNG